MTKSLNKVCTASNMKKRQRGFSLIELIVVVAIVGLVAAAVISRSASTQQSTQIQTESQNLQSIVGKAKSVFAGRPNFNGATTAFMLANGAFPTSMVNNNVVTHSWNGAVTVAPGANPTTLDITYAAVPTAACIEFVSSQSRPYVEVTVAGTAVKNGAAVADTGATQAACESAATVPVIFNTAVQ